MKQFCIALTIVALLLGMAGCKQENDDLLEPVSFYYCNDISSKDDFEHVFVPELREGAGYSDNKPALLSLYLKGPENEDLISPFPAGTSVISVQWSNSHVYIVLSDHMAELTGLDLSMACTCLSMTVFDLYACQAVEISAEHKLLDDQKSIVLTADTLILSDTAYAVNTD